MQDGYSHGSVGVSVEMDVVGASTTYSRKARMHTAREQLLLTRRSMDGSPVSSTALFLGEVLNCHKFIPCMLIPTTVSCRHVFHWMGEKLCCMSEQCCSPPPHNELLREAFNVNRRPTQEEVGIEYSGQL